MDYRTFEILIISSGTENRYQIVARSKQGDKNASTTINPKSPPLVRLLKQLEEQTISDKGLEKLGTELYKCLFVDEIDALFNRALGEALARADLGLRLRLIIEVPELNKLPWELIYSPNQQRFLIKSTETPLSRYISVDDPMRELTCPDQLRILAVIPQSSGLNTEPEKKVLREVERKLASKIKVDFLEGPATGDAIRAALRDQDYHIFHYAGHGLFQHNQAFLILDYSEQSRDFLTAEQFAHFFQNYHSIRLVVLNACQGATRSSHQALAGMAPQLVGKGVPAVIAMQDSIRDTDAIWFATEFYSVLCHERHGGQVEMAVARARNALFQSPSQVYAFALPVLFLRAPDGKLWDVKLPAEKIVPVPKPAFKSATEAPSLHSGIKQLLPYTAEDAELFLKLQRRTDLEQCLRAITHADFRLGILLGESGCGKTSFLQAGLVPMVAKHCPSFRAIYVKFSNEDPIKSIQQALIRETNITEQQLDQNNLLPALARIAAAQKQTLILLFDQFEQFFAHFPSEEQRLPLFTLLADWYQHGTNLPVKILLCYRDDLYAQHVDLQQAIGSSQPARDIFYLKKFTPEQATEIFVALAEAEQLQCEKADILKIAQKDLAKKPGERISPVDIQIVSWMIAKQKESGQAQFNEEYFQKMGGIQGLLENYLLDSLQGVPTETQRQLYFKVLLALIDENVRAGVLTLEEIQEKLKGAATAKHVQDAVEWLAHSKTRLITPVKGEDVPGYELAHERLILPIRKLTHKLSTEIEQANMLLDKRTNEWLGNNQESNYLLRWRDLRKISKQQKFLTWGDNEQHKKQLIAQSRRRQRNKILLTMSFIFCLLLAVFSKTTIIPHIQSQQRIKELEKRGLEFVAIPGGTFNMGNLWSDSRKDSVKSSWFDSDYRSNELPVHSVTLSDFYMGKTEVTNSQFAEFLNAYGRDTDDNGQTMIYEHEWGVRKDSSSWQPQTGYENHPVVRVTWFGASQFAKWAACRLPTEAEWEYAARARGKEITYPWGNDPPDSSKSNYWIDGRENESKPVGKYAENELGLYDMAGNVWEWCADWYDEKYYKKSPQNNPKGPSTPTGVRVLRGGSWSYYEGLLRCSYRDYRAPYDSHHYVGFRLVR